jgi:proteasome lid subunit RPN8/RPN11
LEDLYIASVGGATIMSIVVLNTEQRRAIARHGEASYPKESRGLLLGHRNGITKQVVELMFFDAVPESESEGHRYHIPSGEMQEGEELARAKDLEIVGSFHSHVDQPARPSIHDREFVEPTFTYVIVGIREGRAHELAAWKLSEDKTAFFQEDIRSS